MIQVDTNYPLRALAIDMHGLELLLDRYMQDALAGDVGAGHLVLRLLERKAACLGLDSPVKIDAQLVEATPESSTARIDRALQALLSQQDSETDSTH